MNAVEAWQRDNDRLMLRVLDAGEAIEQLTFRVMTEEIGDEEFDLRVSEVKAEMAAITSEKAKLEKRRPASYDPPNPQSAPATLR